MIGGERKVEAHNQPFLFCKDIFVVKFRSHYVRQSVQGSAELKGVELSHPEFTPEPINSSLVHH